MGLSNSRREPFGSRGCGASLITILGKQKFRKEEDEYKVFALADSDYCKASSTARQPKKKIKSLSTT